MREQDWVVSVVVPTLNRHEDISFFVQSLCQQSHQPNEFIVVDAGEESDLQDKLHTWLKDTTIELIYCRSTPGTSLQRNVAIKKAKGDILFFFDDDVILEPDYIEKTLPCFSIPTEPPVGGVLGTFTSPYRQKWQKKLFFKLFRMSHSVEGDTAHFMSSSDTQWLVKPSKVVPVPVCSGGRVAFRKECFEKELWDDFLPGYTMSEDVEISYRIARNWTLVQTPYALLYHERSDHSRNDFSDRIARRLFSRYYIFQKNVPKNPRTIAGFIWWNIGASILYSVPAIFNKNQDKRIQGLKNGYKLCGKHLLKKYSISK